MASTGDSWFRSSGKAGRSAALYGAVRPCGMTNPPQNPRVREALLQDLEDYGIATETESWARSTWPPPHPIRTAPGQNQWLEGSRSAPSVPCSPSSSTAKTRQLPRETTMEFADVTKRPAYRFGGEGRDEELTTGPNADLMSQVHGLPTPLWRSIPFSLEDKSSKVTRRRRTEQPRADNKGNQRHSSNEKWIHAKERPKPRYLTDYEFRNAVEVLRARSGQHTAAVSDRFVAGADTSPDAPLVIKGAGTASGKNHCAWASDGADLFSFHSSATRALVPSSLQPIKDDEAQATKKTRRKDDINYLEMSDTGIFRPLYPIDSSLKTMRRLKKVLSDDKK